MIDRLGQFTQRRITRLAVDLLLSWIDQNDAAAVAELSQIAEDLAGPSRPLGGADNCH